MKKINWPLIATAVVVLLAAGAAIIWSGTQPSKLAPPPRSAAGTKEASRALPKIITLYQKGEGESDLAVYVARELAGQARGLAAFSNIDTSDEPQMLEYYGVSSVPAIIFLSPAGKVVQKHEGYLDKAAILKVLRSIK